MKRAIVFPGQSSQYVGMGKDLYENFHIIKNMFTQADNILGFSLSEIILNGPSDKLCLTENAQPAIMTVSIALLKVLLNMIGVGNISNYCDYVAGHSLGEYTALCASESLNFENAVNLLKVRGKAMSDASTNFDTSMIACIGLDIKRIKNIIEQENYEHKICNIANDNSNSQIVVSGESSVVNKIFFRVKDLGFKAIKLNVSGAFHSEFMIPAQEALQKTLYNTKFLKPKVPLVLNTTATSTRDSDIIKNSLVEQIVSTVRWRETVDTFFELGIKEIIEVGPGKVLSGLIRQSPYSFKVTNISSLDDIKRFCTNLN